MYSYIYSYIFNHQILVLFFVQFKFTTFPLIPYTLFVPKFNHFVEHNFQLPHTWRSRILANYQSGNNILTYRGHGSHGCTRSRG